MTRPTPSTTTRRRFGRLPASLALVAVCATIGLTGCETQSFIDPSEVVDPKLGNKLYGGEPLIVPILDDLDFVGVDDQVGYFADARPVQQSDLEADNEDYRIGANDVLQVVIPNLQGEGRDEATVRRVSASGTLPLPLIDRPVDVAGLTEAQAQSAIADVYRDAQILRNPQPSVVVTESRNRVFTISGSIPTPGSYAILQSNFRLTDAITLAGGLAPASGVDFVYVVRYTADENGGVPDQDAPNQRPQGDDPLAPTSLRLENLQNSTAARALRGPTWETVFNNTQDATEDELDPAVGIPQGGEGRTLQIDGRDVALDQPGEGGDATDIRIQPVEDDVTLEPEELPEPALEPLADLPGSSGAYDFPELDPPAMEVIQVPLQRLLKGQYEYNVAIRPGDQIVIAQPNSVGVYYMAGHVNRVGVYGLSGNKVTVTQAVAAAGMLDQVAIPSRTALVRRQTLADGSEVNVHVRIDLQKIFNGSQPNIYIHPDDEIRVGTNFAAPWIASLRNAFRITYGFGFLYDRNFAASDNESD